MPPAAEARFQFRRIMRDQGPGRTIAVPQEHSPGAEGIVGALLPKPGSKVKLTRHRSRACHVQQQRQTGSAQVSTFRHGLSRNADS